ncbi:hypothetical protein Pa4123_22620 [Phytohabitans aurantiacus]|uniref:Uncharacterized protein n=1 Tax=Phytohabitans aurantiacus TaxID=3016789 RepID=A0ABQ5QQX7_9ACTN|nr:hypothetical protein Pa4123_22620 [Phytohabitans aurantiacus]
MRESLPRVSTPACRCEYAERAKCLTPGFDPGHSGGTVPDSHRVPPSRARPASLAVQVRKRYAARATVLGKPV